MIDAVTDHEPPGATICVFVGLQTFDGNDVRNNNTVNKLCLTTNQHNHAIITNLLYSSITNPNQVLR